MTAPGDARRPGRRRAARRGDTHDPHRSRERALRLLFQAELRGLDPGVVLEQASGDADARSVLDVGEDTDDERDTGAEAAEIDGFTRALVSGVAADLDRIDELLGRFARGWQVRRMPAVDRTVLRLAVHELLDGNTVAPVVIDEAVGFAKDWSTEDSGRYVNGVLEAIRVHLDAGEDGG